MVDGGLGKRIGSLNIDPEKTITHYRKRPRVNPDLRTPHVVIDTIVHLGSIHGAVSGARPLNFPLLPGRRLSA